MAYSDLDAIQVPADNADALATWGAQVGENSRGLFNALNVRWKAWTDFLPAFFNAVGDSLREGYYHHVGYCLTGMAAVKIGSTATFDAGNSQISLPVAYRNHGALIVIGSFTITDASGGKRRGGAVVTDSTTGGTTARLHYGDGTFSDSMTPTLPITLAVDDVIAMNVFYEASSSATFGS